MLGYATGRDTQVRLATAATAKVPPPPLCPRQHGCTGLHQPASPLEMLAVAHIVYHTMRTCPDCTAHAAQCCKHGAPTGLKRLLAYQWGVVSYVSYVCRHTSSAHLPGQTARHTPSSVAAVKPRPANQAAQAHTCCHRPSAPGAAAAATAAGAWQALHLHHHCHPHPP
jgi:hypothetical protein